uniref:NADH:ubiquinone oxidoreductase complex assembly factor 8 n=1 Tax=Amphilophus citrinellus TaxID=61819 RepID=A0A3Q0QYE5_AMPCI
MSGSSVWSRSREKMRLFPELFAQCADEAALYGKCVAATTTGRQELKKDLCAKEFEALKICFTNAEIPKNHNLALKSKL